MVSHDATSFTIAETTLAATRVGRVTTSRTTLDADLVLSGATATAHVRFAFLSPQVLQVLVTLNTNGAARVHEQFKDQREHYYGLWEYPFGGSIDSRGTDHELLGVAHEIGTNFTSGRAPFYVTSRKYGIYAESAARAHYTIAVGGTTGFAFDASELKYNIIYGPGYYDILARYVRIAARPYMPPLWAFDSIWWEDDFHGDLHGADNAQSNVVDLASRLQQYRIPASSLLIDRPYGTGANGWGNMDFDSAFPNPRQMVADLHSRGLNALIWIANRAWNDLFSEGSANGYLFKADSSVGPAADMRNLQARAWFQAKLDAYVNLGVKGYKIDRGDEGEQPAAVQNENVTLFQCAAARGLASRNGTDQLVFSRNVYDTGRRCSAVWSGDPVSDFTGLRYSIAAGLRSGTIAMPLWGSDTGGIVRSQDAPTEELFARWLEFSAFSPIMEVLVGGGHTPWYNYSPSLIDIARDQASRHHDLIPYVRSLMSVAADSGSPIMRPLIFSYPNDDRLANVSDEFLYGSELLVAPVVTAGATSRSVDLPAGRWVDYNDRSTVYAGGHTITASAPLRTIPVFAREGAIVPRGDILKGNNSWTPNWTPTLRIDVFPSDRLDSRFEYYTGTAIKTITASRSGRATTIQFADLELPGTLNVYLKRFDRVVRNGRALIAGTDYTYDKISHMLTVSFSGATSLVIEGAAGIF